MEDRKSPIIRECSIYKYSGTTNYRRFCIPPLFAIWKTFKKIRPTSSSAYMMTGALPLSRVYRLNPPVLVPAAWWVPWWSGPPSGSGYWPPTGGYWPIMGGYWGPPTGPPTGRYPLEHGDHPRGPTHGTIHVTTYGKKNLFFFKRSAILFLPTGPSTGLPIWPFYGTKHGTTHGLHNTRCTTFCYHFTGAGLVSLNRRLEG